MRKALIGILLAATMATPAYAQRQINEEDFGEARAARQAERAERQAQRAERRAQQADAPVAARAADAPARSHRAERREERRHEHGDRREAVRDRIESMREASRASAADAPPHIQRRAAENQARAERRLREQHAGHGDHAERGEHRELHRDYRREHRELHRSDPTRREHREFHRDVNRDHRQVHRDAHRDLHASDPTRREHRRFHREWDRGWRNDNRYDWQRYRYSNRHLFRSGRYYSPFRDHRYSRLSIGLFLGSGFYSDRYWINDPWQYRLPPAYPGTRWVRYYDDVLLVDLYTGEVIDVIYDFFW